MDVFMEGVFFFLEAIESACVKMQRNRTTDRNLN